MLTAVFTLDYEIHGNGEGCSRQLMVEPTDRLLRQFDEYGARLTIMADIGEILKFREYKETTGQDDYHYAAIVEQLQRAVRTGHDVQLHIHSSYFNSIHNGRRWVQDWSEYDFAGLKPARLNDMVRVGKEFLEDLLKPVRPEYQCLAFRAANWSISPSLHVVNALEQNGISIDSSVFKYGRRDGLVRFDYSDAASELVPWRASRKDICQVDEQGTVWEFPIYCEKRWLGAFLTPHRLYRALLSRRYRLHDEAGEDGPTAGNAAPQRRIRAGEKTSLVFGRHAWKADFNQCTGRQLIGALRRAERKYRGLPQDLPFVLIGHSKLFTRANERSLRSFLKFVAANPSRFRFGTFAAFDLASQPPRPRQPMQTRSRAALS